MLNTARHLDSTDITILENTVNGKRGISATKCIDIYCRNWYDNNGISTDKGRKIMQDKINVMNARHSDTEKRVQDSKTEQVYIIRSQHINPQGRLFGGYLMQWIDEMAGIVSRRHSGRMVTTASIDNLSFKAGAYQDDMVVLVGRLTYVGRTSMEVRVDTYVEDYKGNRRNINRAYIVMVAVDEDGNPVEVPGLKVESESERAEWLGGEKRYELRRQRRIEGF